MLREVTLSWSRYSTHYIYISRCVNVTQNNKQTKKSWFCFLFVHIFEWMSTYRDWNLWYHRPNSFFFTVFVHFIFAFRVECYYSNTELNNKFYFVNIFMTFLPSNCPSTVGWFAITFDTCFRLSINSFCHNGILVVSTIFSDSSIDVAIFESNHKRNSMCFPCGVTNVADKFEEIKKNRKPNWKIIQPKHQMYITQRKNNNLETLHNFTDKIKIL